LLTPSHAVSPNAAKAESPNNLLQGGQLPYRQNWSAAVWKADFKHAEIVVKRSPYLDRMGEILVSPYMHTMQSAHVTILKML
jgi:hypothetical protein